MSFRPATSGWEAGDATGSFSLHGSPDGREKLGQQPAPPGAPNHLHVVIVRKGRAAGGRLLLAQRACCGRGQRRTQGGRARGHTRAKRA